MGKNKTNLKSKKKTKRKQLFNLFAFKRIYYLIMELDLVNQYRGSIVSQSELFQSFQDNTPHSIVVIDRLLDYLNEVREMGKILCSI